MFAAQVSGIRDDGYKVALDGNIWSSPTGELKEFPRRRPKQERCWAAVAIPVAHRSPVLWVAHLVRDFANGDELPIHRHVLGA